MPKQTFLEFEQPIAELESKIDELRFVQDDSAVDISEEIERLQKKSQGLLKEIYAKLQSASGTRSYFIDGGFAQVKGSVVSLLTHHAVPADRVDVAAAEQALAEASKLVPTTDAALTEKQHAQDRARRMIVLRRRMG